MEELERYFWENFSLREELGASVSVWKHGEEIISLADGWCERGKSTPWKRETLVPVYSATKGPAAATLLHVLSQKGLDAETPVSELWPAFPAAGATFGDLLSHQCGLAALDEAADVFDHAAVIAAVEKQRPAWELGSGHGYHPRSYGFLLDECVRRLCGRRLGQVWNEDIAAPAGIEFWIGLPEELYGRMASLVPGRAKPSVFEEGFYAAFNQAGSLTRRAFSSPKGLHSISEMNTPRAWGAALPAMGGIGTASGLAKFYQIAIGALDGPLCDQTKRSLAELRCSGEDQVLLRETAFTCGCQMDPLDEFGEKSRQVYGASKAAFGHPGAGGSHGFGDPDSGLSFAYTMNQMELSVMLGERCMGLVNSLEHLSS
jgi:CubicO group peptidase (beta-lactamase class C family)